ncbi:aspartate/glutamate racemase family protein [Levilactobacillus zymae]|uniref:Aspartate racemase n=1 Tax=Levilactobacillus zymae TaxID=267363 RepID=A0A1Y6JXY0_9LACO|nr:amino acid racemase [Levilactobacillus zymae]KRL16564.1 aspartate racemase [Levilactobacillus zymae DSM 19395]QFR60973.1 amino acid racemase [Levilactobacillus zymae]GEO72644.1 aspartate racemase [Levilactobacillus zymae]SMS13962.1 Aspartate racemase [Levilactobacillus zymae]
MQKFFTIIGGMGTMATESYLHQLNLRTPAHADQEYLNYILVNHATVPDRTTYILDHTQESPLPSLLEDIRQQSLLKPEFFTLPCNTAHYFFDELQAATDVPILHMPRETVKEIQRKYPTAKRIGITGTRGTIADKIYEDELNRAGLTPVLPTAAIENQTMELIYDDIKENNTVDAQLFHGIVRQMVEDQHADVVILGCTELSLANEREPETTYPVADGQSILVDRTLEKALALQKK